MKKVIPLMVILILAVAVLTHASDADKLRSEKRAVIGQIVIEMDPSVMNDVAFIIELKTQDKVWIGLLKNFQPKFRAFMEKAAQTGKTVALTGEIEYWTDGIVMHPENMKGYKFAN